MLGYIFRIIKRLFFWGYARNTWQYDVLCACILAFIFLTPQRWFDSGTGMRNWSNGKPVSSPTHQSPVASKVILMGDNFPAQMARNEIENRVRTITGRADIVISDVHPKLDENGKVVAYEVDIK